nr:ubiquitin carboxyl-terminal hydrolase 19-like isoform X2 [Physcomitrium patens]|eukprot:XP_024388652.1 ubiquitin carboxyl-terminal hydrolase 19-like isoform X2 [Physcomitrella patens]
MPARWGRKKKVSMQDLLDASIPAVVLIPLLIVFAVLWGCFQWSVKSSEFRRIEALRIQQLAKEVQDRVEREYEDCNRHQVSLRQRQVAQPKPVDDYRADYRNQPAAGFVYPRRAQLDQDYIVGGTKNYSRKQGEEEIRRRSWAEERKEAEAEEFRVKQAGEYNTRKQAELENLRRKQAQAEEELRQKEIADAEVRRILAQEAERKLLQENRERYEDEEVLKKKRLAEIDENNKRAALEAQAKLLAEKKDYTSKEAVESSPKRTQGYICIVCLQRTKRRCSRCKAVFYCSRECQERHWHGGHKNDCRIFDSSSSPRSSNGDNRDVSDSLTPRSSISNTSIDESVAPLLSPALSPAISPAISPAPTHETPMVSHSAPISPQPGSLLKTSSILLSDGRRIKPKKMLFPYEYFIELFDTDIKFLPCGLVNCGNSFSVGRCIPIFEWGFGSSTICYFEVIYLLLPCSSAIHLMQSICLDGAGGENAVDACTEETTLIHHIFGGLLQSQVTCKQCRHQSNSYEIMMDLTVEINRNVRSLEDALAQFSAHEFLHGENKYKCDRCDAYVDAYKRIAVHEAPNVLVVTLKRFKGGRYEKLTKEVVFPEILDLTPYMSENGDRPPHYNLYAVVVHVNESNASHYGHYFCLVMNPSSHWYRVDDMKVTEVSVNWVTSQEAYILLYKRSKSRLMDFTDNADHPVKSVAQNGSVSNGFIAHPQAQ